MSLCDRCYAPGFCCRGFALWGPDGEPVLYDREAEAWTVGPHPEPFTLGEFVRYEEHGGKTLERWDWNCSALQPNGRCGIYEGRPQLCRDFAPASSPLCVHYRGAESGDASAGLP